MQLEFCDLHTHSIFSDGTDTPKEILLKAVSRGLRAVALCDHNTANGLADFLAAAEGLPIEAVAGVELSVDLDGTELHLLGLHIPPQHFPTANAMIASVNQRKEASNQAMVRSLSEACYPIDYEALKRKVSAATPNRAHIAAELTELGLTASIDEAFRTLLSEEAGHYVPPKRLTVWEALEFLRSIQAVPVLAHPLLNLDRERLQNFLKKAVGCGLLGMETDYSLADEETRIYLRELAKEFGLLPSGGSDYHGTNKPTIQLGAGEGDLAVPYAYALALQAKSNCLQTKN